MSYKWCAVPLCRNTTIKTPDKLFVSVPKNPTKRRNWLRLARRDPSDISNSSVIFFCEDHFNVEKDMANYFQHKMGFSQRVKMAEGALPSKFHCQQERRRQHESEQCVQIQLYEGYESITDPWATAQKKAKSFAAHLVNNESSFRTVSIEVVRTTDDEEYDGDIFEPAVTVQEEDCESKTENKSRFYAHHVPQEIIMKSENAKTVFCPTGYEKTTRSTSTNTAFMADKFVQYCYKPKYRSKAVQTRIVYINNSSGKTCVGSTSALKNNTSCNVQLSHKEIRELETSVRISDRKLYRSWETVKDCKDPEAYETLLDEVKNKQKTLNCMLQLIENRQALLLREQKRNEAEDDVVALPTKRHQDTRRCLKRKRRPHESKSDHKSQIAPKQVTLYITGSSTVEEAESTRSSSELPSVGPTPNVMFFTPNLT